jgi:hypothetical protein
MILLHAGRDPPLRAPFGRQLRGLAMIDNDYEHFDVRAISPREVNRRADYAKNMLFAATAASLSIVGAGAFFLGLF